MADRFYTSALFFMALTLAMSSANSQPQQREYDEIKVINILFAHYLVQFSITTKLIYLFFEILKTLFEKAVARLEILESKVLEQYVKVNSQEMRLGEAERKIETIFLLTQPTNSSNAADNRIPISSGKRLKRSHKQSPNESRKNVTRKSKMKIINSDSDTLKNQAKAATAAANPHAIKIQYRSCHEIFVAHSGQVSSKLTYNQNKLTTYIDPDGLGIGDPPIFVECDMTNGIIIIIYIKLIRIQATFLILNLIKGTTRVIAYVDKEEDDTIILNIAENIPVKNCTSPGCSVHEIDYNIVSLRQLVALSQISSECRQFIRVILFIELANKI